MLDTLASDIDRHLIRVGDVLTQMLPAPRVVTAADHRSLRAKEKN